MDTHDDKEHTDVNTLYQAFRKRAEDMKAQGLSQITSGAPGEVPLCEWTRGNFRIREMQPDEVGVLRISIGGGGLMGDAGYLVYRGHQREIIELLEIALRNLRAVKDDQ